jgi:hypothetical protein
LEQRDYDAFLRNKVDAARSSMRAGRGRSNEDVEADFAARRAKAAARNEQSGPGGKGL